MLTKQTPLKINRFAETRKSQHLRGVSLIYPRLFTEAPPPLVKEEVHRVFPPKPNISIPFHDWSRDLVPLVHKYSGKLEINSYVR